MNDEFMEEYTRIAEVFRTCWTDYGVEDRPSCDECPYSELRKTVYSADGRTPLYTDDSECTLALVNKAYEMLDELIIMVDQYRQIEKRGNEIISELGDKVRAIPAADVVAVVRCRECKHSIMHKFPYNYEKVLACNDPHGVTIRAVKPMHFCSYGERKDGGQDDV